jgi:parallel beta-helix repeat protein
VSNNLSDGIAAGAGCTITGSTARGNNGNGISGSTGCTVLGCTAVGNIAANGIQVGSHGVVKDCASSQNNSAGILVSGNRSIVENCSADSNSGMGIVSAGNGTGTVIRNCSASDNVGDGINVFRSCLVIGNVSTSNGNGAPFAAGIHVLSFASRIEGNTVSTNDRGILIDDSIGGTANLIIRNNAGSNTINYDIVDGNKVATIITPANSAAISGSSGGTAFGDAWSNISH